MNSKLLKTNTKYKSCIEDNTTVDLPIVWYASATKHSIWSISDDNIYVLATPSGKTEKSLKRSVHATLRAIR